MAPRFHFKIIGFRKSKQLIYLLLCFLLYSPGVFSQYWQQEVNYIIDVKLNEAEKTLDGFEKISYTNHSPDTLYFIWFHLWPNAYKNDRTAFNDQLLENGSTKFYFSGKQERGYINRLDFKVDGVTARSEDHPQYIDVIKLVLPRPLPPRQSTTITTPFHVKLPYNISRGGYEGSSFQVTQWYPKPSVYDQKGWHPMPYLDQGEFYSEFGSFDVRITVPENYIVAATGNLKTTSELEKLKALSTLPEAVNPKIPKPQNPGIKNKQTDAANVPTKTLQFVQDRVHDFAWFANKDFLVNHDTCSLGSGRIIDVFSYYIPEHTALWKNTVQYAKDALRFYSAELGEYPYEIASVVQGPQSFGGGMEYPTITIISPISSAQELDVTIAHELGHNWFYGILASNERDHPWMDEGMNTYYTQRYESAKYGGTDQIPGLVFQNQALKKTDQPIETNSEAFSATNYGLVAYYKTGQWMHLLESRLGRDSFRKMMQEYFSSWKFKHPQPEDFRSIAASYLKNNTEPIFSLLNKTDVLPGNEPAGFSVISPFKKNSFKNYIQQPTKNVLLIFPALGYNSYDKLMAGLVFSNYKIPPAPFSYLVTPMYSTGSGSIAGLGKMNYSIYSEGAIRKADFFLNLSRFSMNDYKDSTGNKYIMHFNKLVPGFKLTFKESNPRSTVTRQLQWKTFFIKEGSLSVDQISPRQYSVVNRNRYVNQLNLVYENARALYPFDATLQLEQGADFFRPTFTTNYFFNYPKAGGLELRFFAGKFFYLKQKTQQTQFRTERYHLNMSGPNGFEDYTYSDYFLGRNEFQTFPSQQMMLRDGAFKARTDLLSSKVGKTDDWLLAANLNTTIPENINPLSVLPIKIPLRLFADVGTYAEAWEANTDRDRFVFTAGMQLTLFKDVLNLYFPLVYSKAFGSYFKSAIPDNRFFKTMTFTINFYTKELKKINRQPEF